MVAITWKTTPDLIRAGKKFTAEHSNSENAILADLVGGSSKSVLLLRIKTTGKAEAKSTLSRLDLIVRFRTSQFSTKFA